MLLRSLALSCVAAGFVLASSSNAHAQQAPYPPGVQQQQQQPQYYPAPPQTYGAAQPQGQQMYPAPLTQQYQPSYIPQSVALSGPEELTDWNEGEPIPPGYHPVDRTRKGLIIGGSITFASLYGISLFAAAIGHDVSDDGSNPVSALYVPVVGPFIQMAKTDSATANLFLAVDGLAQTAGLAMFFYGMTVPKTILVRNDLAEAKPHVTLAPMIAKGTTGLGVIGTF
jgi:hypothetical protein